MGFNAVAREKIYSGRLVTCASASINELLIIILAKYSTLTTAGAPFSTHKSQIQRIFVLSKVTTVCLLLGHVRVCLRQSTL